MSQRQDAAIGVAGDGAFDIKLDNAFFIAFGLAHIQQCVERARRVMQDTPQLFDEDEHILSRDYLVPARDQNVVRDEPAYLDRHGHFRQKHVCPKGLYPFQYTTR